LRYHKYHYNTGTESTAFLDIWTHKPPQVGHPPTSLFSSHRDLRHKSVWVCGCIYTSKQRNNKSLLNRAMAPRTRSRRISTVYIYILYYTLIIHSKSNHHLYNILVYIYPQHTRGIHRVRYFFISPRFHSGRLFVICIPTYNM